MTYIAQSLVAINTRSAYLSWDPTEEDDDMDGYNVYMASAAVATWTRLNASPVTEPSFVTPPLRTDLFYLFRVSSVDTTGNESDPSAPIEFRFSDYNASMPFRLVKPREKIILSAATKKTMSPLFPDFMTLIQLSDGYLSGRRDITIVANTQTIQAAGPANFITQFTLGG